MVSGLFAGLLAVGIALLLTAGKMQPDAFSMALIGTGIALVAGGHTKYVLERALGPVARALVAAAEKDRGPP